MDLVLTLIEKLSVLIIIAYFMTRTTFYSSIINKKLTNKNDCLDKPLCTWEKSLGIGDYTPEPYCVNKDYGDYTRIKNMSREFQKEQDNLSENFKESLL